MNNRIAVAIACLCSVFVCQNIALAQKVNTLGTPTLPYKVIGGVKVFELVAEPVTKKFVHDQPQGDFLVWGYNGSMPGPTIEVTEGDRVRINFKNKLPVPTTVHWHGIHLPNEMDGAPGVTQKPVPPGGNFVYEFTLKQNGTYMYHSGMMGAMQVGMGLGGFFIVHPKKEQLPKVDKDFAIMLQIWNLPPHGNIPDPMSMMFNYFTMNGLSAPDVPHMVVKKGERVRVRIANLSMMSHPIHLHGFTFWTTGTSGGRIPQTAWWPESTTSVSAGQIRDIEFVAHETGDWLFHCHFLHHITNDMDRPMIPGQPMWTGAHGHGGMFTILEVKDGN